MTLRRRKFPRVRFWQAAALGYQGGRGGGSQSSPGAPTGTPGTGEDTSLYLVDAFGIGLVDAGGVQLVAAST